MPCTVKKSRKVFVYKNINHISTDRINLKRLIRVERTVFTKKEERHQVAYYISDVRSDKAQFFAGHIQNHGAIENRLHWVKDVILKEDSCKTIGGMAAENFSIIRNITCNIFRSNMDYDPLSMQWNYTPIMSKNLCR